MAHKDTIPLIKKGLSLLPGWQAQCRMAPIKDEKYRQPSTSSKQAGVIALLYPNAKDMLEMVYIKRASIHKGDKHSGQVSFPGGQQEDADNDLEHTSLRELEEELGIPSSEVEILGALSSIFIWVSDFYVQPYLAYLHHMPDFIPQASEVDYPITMSIEELFHKGSKSVKDIQIRNQTLPRVPYYDLKGDVLWGATAMITSEIEVLFHTIRHG